MCPICNSPNAPHATICAACGASLAGASTSGSPAGDGAASVSQHALSLGASLHHDHYRIEGVLGQGGFGITYRARDNNLQREVAIKEFFPFEMALRIRQDNRLEPTGGLSRGEFEKMRAQFLDEARVLARFNHRGIVNVYTVFEEKNTVYMVMEFLRGQSLMQLLEARGKIPENEAVELIGKAGEALEEVHKIGLLHRDLKPDNIQVWDTRVVLLDFGSAFSFSEGEVHVEPRVTPGYAPLEQYSATARFAAYTDIYALGATLYHLLTGIAPPAATDRANGVELSSPHQVAGVSREVSDATMWALEINAGKRPQSVGEWLAALRQNKAARDGSTPAAPGHSTRTSSVSLDSDPRGERIKAILQELSTPARDPASVHDARLREIESELARVANFVAPPDEVCPVCNAHDLRHIAPAVGAAQCPLCDGALEHRQFNTHRCAVCRQDTLQEYVFNERQMFCPLCQAAPLKEEKRHKLVGLVVDLWLLCPYCKAEWDEYSNGTAQLINVGNAPSIGDETRRRGEEWLHQTKPLSEWKTLSGRADRVLHCASCKAQWDILPDGRDHLVRWPRDPFGVGKQYGDKAFFRRAWTRLAHGLPLAGGNCTCRDCRAEWNWDAQSHSLKLLSADDRYAAHRGKTQTPTAWRFEISGKSSGRAGDICTHCQSEWDDENDLAKLVRAGRDNFASLVGARYSLLDWHRLARGLPDTIREAALQQEAAQIKSAKTIELQSWREKQELQRRNLEHDLDALLRQSVLSGHLQTPLPRVRSLQRGETARWVGPAILLKFRSSRGMAFWDTDRQGTLALSDARLLFEDAPGVLVWERPLSKLRSVETPSLAGRILLELHFHGLKNPVGFFVIETALDVVIEGRSRRLVFTAADLAAWLRTSAGQ